MAFALLERAIEKLMKEDKRARTTSWKERLRYVWREDHMTMLLARMHGIRDAVNLLLTLLQT